MNNPWIKKVWGLTRCILKQRGFEVHELNVLPGGYCSVHRHMDKENLFVVAEGRIIIETGSTDEAWQVSNISRVSLEKGGHVEIPAGVWHRFESAEGARLIEVYHGDWRGEDIERATVGGRRV